jgi:hypothetical protein
MEKRKFRKEHVLEITRLGMETPSKESITWSINAYEKQK